MIAMSEERVTLEFVGTRLLALTADVRELQQRFVERPGVRE